jgi:RNA polymerase sigma factor (sigma-70 family)
MDDRELLQRWAAGDTNAGEALFERHFDAVGRFFANKVDTALEDLVQQTFLACIESATRFRGESTVRSWLLGIANNVLRNHYTAQHRAPVPYATASFEDLAPSVSRMLQLAQSQEALLTALRRVPIDLQVVLELFFWEDMSGPEIAATLGLPEGTVRSRLRRGRELVAEMMGGETTLDTAQTQTRDDLDRWSAELKARAHRPQS